MAGNTVENAGGEVWRRDVRVARRREWQLEHHHCSGAGYAIRPALLFSSSLLVSIEDEEAADEASLYSGYVDYVREWMDEDPDVGSSPMSYEEWKKDGGQEEA